MDDTTKKLVAGLRRLNSISKSLAVLQVDGRHQNEAFRECMQNLHNALLALSDVLDQRIKNDTSTIL